MKRLTPSAHTTVLALTILVVLISSGFAFTTTRATVVGVPASLSAMIAYFSGYSAPQSLVPSVTTEKTAYKRGETVNIFGAGYSPGQVVSLEIASRGFPYDPLSATADGTGNFTVQWVMPNSTPANSFTLSADGTIVGKFRRVAVVHTDKFDYQPGETAIISGEGFNSNETVTLQVVHSNGANGGNGHLPFDARAGEDGRLDATWYVDPDDSFESIFRLSAVASESNLVATSTFTDVFITVVDDAGADDEPGQKDLNSLAFENGATAVGILWNWDDIAWPGNNTGDACTLVDTDADGFANWAFCITVDSTPAMFVEKRLYRCDADSKTDRCAGDVLITTPMSSVGTASIVPNSDPFGIPGPTFDPDHITGNECSDTPTCRTSDMVANVTLQLSDVGGAAAKILNVCSFPSEQPNSDPSDCVFAPNNGFLTIVKNSNPNNGTQFTFNLGAGPNFPRRREQLDDQRQRFSFTRLVRSGNDIRLERSCPGRLEARLCLVRDPDSTDDRNRNTGRSPRPEWSDQ